MTDRAKLEQMLQYLINEDKEKAEELFHELVVAKSREIYENLLDDDIQVDEETEDEDLDEESDDEELDEESDDEDLEENYGIDEIGGDPSDDMMSDVKGDIGDMGDDDMDSSEGGAEAATKDDVMDIKDALEELKAEFEAMLAGSDDSEDMGDMDDEEGDDDMDDEEGDDDMDDEGNPFAKENVREYVEKVQNGSGPWGSTKGDNGANTKSIVAGKNDMGGTTANIVKGGTSETGGTKGGLAQPNPKDMTTGNVNVPGGNAGKTGFKKKEPGHGAERKGTGDMGDKSAGSPINGAPKRAK